MWRPQLALVGVVLGAVLSSCSVDDPELDAATLAKRKAFAAIRQEARENGGDAIWVTAGYPAELEIVNPDSPIFGTRVRIPSDALPVGTPDSVLAVQHIAEFALDGTDDTQIGEPVAIDLKPIGAEASLELERPATVTLPFTTATDVERAKIRGSHFVAATKQWTYLTHGALADHSPRVNGKTLSFSPFVAVQAVVPMKKDKLTYVATRGGSVVCEGEIDLPTAPSLGAYYRPLDPQTGELKLEVMGTLNGYPKFNLTNETSPLAVPSPQRLLLSDDFTDKATISFQCDRYAQSLVSANDPGSWRIRTVETSDWNELSQYTSQRCGTAVGTCVSSLGTGRVRLRLKITHDAEPGFVAEVAIDYEVNNFEWSFVK